MKNNQEEQQGRHVAEHVSFDPSCLAVCSSNFEREIAEQGVLLSWRDRPLGDVQEAMENISSNASTDLFCKTFMNLPPFSVLWEEVRAHLATRAKNTQVADVIRGVLLTDAFKALEAAMQLPLDARDLRLAASAKVEAHRLFGYLGENASLFSLNAQSGTNVKDATTEVLVAFCTLVIRPLTDLAFQKANCLIEEMNGHIKQAVEDQENHGVSQVVTTEMNECVRTFLAVAQESFSHLEHCINNIQSAMTTCHLENNDTQHFQKRSAVLQFVVAVNRALNEACSSSQFLVGSRLDTTTFLNGWLEPPLC